MRSDGLSREMNLAAASAAYLPRSVLTFPWSTTIMMQAAADRAGVRAVVRGVGIGNGRLARRGDELDRGHRPGLAVDREREIFGPRSQHGTPVAVEDGDVHRHQLDGRAEGRGRLLRPLPEPARGDLWNRVRAG